MTFTLPSGTQHAIRGQFRNAGSGGELTPCVAGTWNDRDDLVFTAVDLPPP